MTEDRNQWAIFGGGCFWCVEAVFERQDGVISVTSGYAGGTVDHPTYEQVCSGTTGHAEVVQVEFDPARISYDDLLEVFWLTHDPTTLNRQGGDVGTQYRSVIYTQDDSQMEQARASLEKNQSRFAQPIVTELAPLDRFWPAEGYHQDYYRLNGSAPFCRAVIQPKLRKLGLEPS